LLDPHLNQPIYKYVPFAVIVLRNSSFEDLSSFACN